MAIAVLGPLTKQSARGYEAPAPIKQ